MKTRKEILQKYRIDEFRIVEDSQLAAVSKNGFLVGNIKNPSEKIQLAAVLRDPGSITRIENPTEKVQLLAVKHDPNLIVAIDNPTKKVQLLAIKNNLKKDYISSISDLNVLEKFCKIIVMKDVMEE